PASAQTLTNLGEALREQGNLEEGAELCRQAAELQPDFVEAHNNLGLALQMLGRPQQAIACYERALQLHPNYPDARWNRSLLLLLAGDFNQGWQEYEWRWQCKGFPPRGFRQPLWSSEDLTGKTILLHAEQGLGDTIQFIRYAQLV